MLDHLLVKHRVPSNGIPRTVLLFLTICTLITLSLLSIPADAAEEDDSSEHDYHNSELTFLLISFVMTYGATAVLVSVFTFKYGQGKAKIIAIPMLLSGLLIWLIWIYFKFIINAAYPDDTILNIIHWSAAPILKPLLAVIGVFLGGGLSLFIFLTMVVRS